MKIYFFSLIFICLTIFTGCYVDEVPTPTDEPSPEPTPVSFGDETKITAFDGEAGDSFGCSVSISGDYAIVGASQDSDTEDQSGSAYIYTKTGSVWVVQQKLTATPPEAHNYFGNSVSIYEDYAIIGSIYDNSGSAYIYNLNGSIWTEQQILTLSDGAYMFGRSVNISGNYVIIGATYFDEADIFGSAYIFVREGTTWTEQQKLLPSDEVVENNFGNSVNISGNYAIIGAPGNDDFGTDSGSAYIFKWDGTTWIQQQKLLAHDGAPGDQFGYSVSISGDYAIIGTPYHEDIGYDTGAAYIFVRDEATWIEQQKLTAQDGTSTDSFGRSVSISGDYAVVSASDDDDIALDAGAAYIFTRDGTTWTEQQKIKASDGATDDKFGSPVCISDTSIIIGVTGDDDNGDNSGSVYIFE